MRGKFSLTRLILYVLAIFLACALLAYSLDILSTANNPPPTQTPGSVKATITRTYRLATLPAAKTPTTTQIPPGTPDAPYTDCIPSDTMVSYATVVGIIDGDTINIRMEDGTAERVRYIGMDTPERGDALSVAATERNAQLTEGKVVMLVKDVSEVDPFDRLLRYVIVEGVFVNDALVREGLAWAKSYPPDTACNEAFRQAQAAAREAQLGIWSPSSPHFTPLPPTLEPGVAVCDCSADSLNCGDFATQAGSQACFDYCLSLGAGDVHLLDADQNGTACEGLP